MRQLLPIRNLLFFLLLVCLSSCFIKGHEKYSANEREREREREEREHRRHKKKGPQKVERQGFGEEEEEEGEGNEHYDGILSAQQLEFEKTHDPNTNIIPKERLVEALAQREEAVEQMQKANENGAPAAFLNPTSTIGNIAWTERGSNRDAPGPYGNSRDNNGVTSGRIRALWRDLDPAMPNRIFTGGIDGGLWTCADITQSVPGWTFIDNFSNIGISSICQDPTNYNIMYFGTGEKTYNADAVRGGGVWKSTNHGATWTFLANTANFFNVSRVLCDSSGNVYVATIGSGVGLQRSTNGGTSWTNITPTINAITNTRVSDIVYDASIDRMGVYMGYYPGNTTTKVGYCYGTPSTVTSSTWNTPVNVAAGAGVTADSGMFVSFATSSALLYQTILSAKNGVVWALKSVYGSSTALKVYRSLNGGATWTQQSPALTASAYGAGQGWYSIGIDCDPANATASANNLFIGGLNMFKSTNGGTSFSQVSRWVASTSAGSVAQYVHADIQNILYDTSRIISCNDGGIFYSSNVGSTWADRNTGLRIKQFYSCAIHPTLGNYFLAGAQDNGSHQFTQPGLGPSTEVTGGDGAFVAIDQLNPNNQVTSYVYNSYYISTDGGNNWSNKSFGSSAGRFINPFEFDSKTKRLYAAYTAGNYLRWNNPTGTQDSSFVIPVASVMGNSILTAVTVSPNILNTIYISSATAVARVANAHTATPSLTNITPPITAGSYISSIVIGPDAADNDILVTSSSYGAKKVFISNNGGSSWTEITGNLPDMPVRWGFFYPGANNQILLATEAGVWYATANGANTTWQPSVGIPAVRCDMIRYSDVNGVVAVGTHGRGLWTAKLNALPKVSFTNIGNSTVAKTTAATTGCRSYKDYTANLTISDAPAGNANVNIIPQSGSTAVLGVDYDYTTNGSFTSPSTVATFNSSVFPNTIPVTIRVYDTHDNNSPSFQTIIFGYSISGTTNAIAGGDIQTYTLNLTDLIRPANVALPNQVLWTENWENASTYANWTFLPDAYNSNPPNRVAFVPYNSGCSGNINATTAQVLTTNASGVISLCANGNGGVADSAFMYRAINAGTNHYANMSVAFNYKSGANANVTTSLVYSTDNGLTWNLLKNYTARTTTTRDSVIIPASLDYTNYLLAWRLSQTAAATYTAYGFGVDDISFRSDIVPAPIESAVTSTALYEANGQNIDYYSPAGKIIATLANPNADLGCVTAGVDAAGTTWQPLLGGTVSEKSIVITPSQNSSASYTVTLYYTTAELAGRNPATLRILKTNAASIAGATVSNSVIVTPTQVNYSSYGVAFTGSFTGFSRFALIDNNVVLPVTLVNFSGTLQGANAVLQWTTASEANSRNFEIEKSADAVSFTKIGTVAAAGNLATSRNYSFTDFNLTGGSYYRLKINDIDGKYVYSNVIYLRYENAAQDVMVLNNPFTTELRLKIAVPAAKVVVQLFDSKGRQVYTNTYGSGQSNLTITPPSLAAGSYFLKVNMNGQEYSFKVVKE